MLEVLFGNKNVQKVLIFLFVNRKCYGAEVQQALKMSLTSIQKALMQLEQENLIHSHLDEKTRVYQFNPEYPLLKELEALLKRAYNLLPAHEKKSYYVIQENPAFSVMNKAKVLDAFWEKLKNVTQLTFHAKTNSKNAGGWDGKGVGTVASNKDEANVLIFNEKGVWSGRQGTDVGFSNMFRWTLDHSAQMISLEHLRRGSAQPVFLFYLTPTDNHALSSVDSHLCGGDTYFGQIQFDQSSIRLSWRVIGLKKDEELDYYYS